jgi:formate hydrogenlyase subunit 3/multisubunit Na+/H+ antiporter MnhD subunit
MANLYLVPDWFFGFDIIFELAFAIITLIVALYAFKVYRLSEQNQSKLFGWAFIFFSISYFIQSLLNFVIISKLSETICDVIKLQSVTILNAWGISIHMILLIIGLVTLAYMTLKINNPKAYSLVLLISLFSIILSLNKIYWFYFLSSILLIFIVIHYTQNYLKNKQSKTLLVLMAFLFLLFGHIHFIFAVNHALFYVIGHFLELIAYILILINLLLVLKNGKKAR